MTAQRIFLFFTLLAIIGIAGFVLLRRKPLDPAARPAAEREVYSALLREQESRDIEIQQVVAYTNAGELRGNTPQDSAGIQVSPNLDDFPGLERETWLDFAEMNRMTYPIQDLLPPGMDILLIDPANSEQLHWWLSFSRIGFNSSLTQALVLVGDCRGEACYDSTSPYLYSRGNYVFLQKKNGEWLIQSQYNTWFIEAPSP